MGAKKGTNNGVKGKPGRSGRKSAYREKLDAQYLIDLVMKDHTKEELRQLISGEKVPMNLLERMVIAAHTGKERTAVAIFSKLFPDHLKLDDSEIKHYFILD